jgi:coproporphyrinogen III oxidase-like Fe-S oxidoreductase
MVFGLNNMKYNSKIRTNSQYLKSIDRINYHLKNIYNLSYKDRIEIEMLLDLIDDFEINLSGCNNDKN